MHVLFVRGWGEESRKMWWGRGRRRRLSSGKRGEGSGVNWSTITVVVCTTGSSNMREADHSEGMCEISRAK